MFPQTLKEKEVGGCRDTECQAGPWLRGREVPVTSTTSTLCLASLHLRDSRPLPLLRRHHKLLGHKLTGFESTQRQSRNQARGGGICKEKKSAGDERGCWKWVSRSEQQRGLPIISLLGLPGGQSGSPNSLLPSPLPRSSLAIFKKHTQAEINPSNVITDLLSLM